MTKPPSLGTTPPLFYEKNYTHTLPSYFLQEVLINLKLLKTNTKQKWIEACQRKYAWQCLVRAVQGLRAERYC